MFKQIKRPPTHVVLNPGRSALGSRGRSGAMNFPHRTTIERATGLSIPGRATVSPALSPEITPAFTDGLHSIFAQGDPPVRIAAHEAAHQFQHAGLTHDGGLGPERHADQFAQAIQRGQSARSMITDIGRRVPPKPRPYKEFQKMPPDTVTPPAGPWSKLPEPFRLAYDPQSPVALAAVSAQQTKTFFADRQLVQRANSILSHKDSGVELDTTNGNVISGGPLTKPLTQVTINFKSNTPGSSVMGVVPVGGTYVDCDTDETREFSAPGETYADCGGNAREIMGPYGEDLSPAARVRDRHGDQTYAKTQEDHNRVKLEVIEESLGMNYNRYQHADPNLADQEDERHHINKYADPNVGDAYTIFSDFAVDTDGDPSTPADAAAGYHFAPVIMLIGNDRITLEHQGNLSYHPTRNRCMNDAWFIEMYGGPGVKKQTFFERHGGERASGDFSVAMETRDYKNYSTKGLIEEYNGLESDRAAAKLVAHELIKRNIVVKVTPINTNDVNKDEIILEIAGPGLGGKTYMSSGTPPAPKRTRPRLSASKSDTSSILRSTKSSIRAIRSR